MKTSKSASKSASKLSKTSKSISKSPSIQNKVIDLSILSKIVKEKYYETLINIKNSAIDYENNIKQEIEKYVLTDLYKKQENIYKMLSKIIMLFFDHIEFVDLSKSSTKISLYIPSNENNLNSCIKAEFNYKNKTKSAGSGVFGDVIQTQGKKFKYAIKIVNIEKTEDDYKLNTRDIEREIEITRKMGELGIGPKLYDVYQCKKDDKLNYYFVLEYMNQGSLDTYMSKHNIITISKDAYATKIISDKLELMHKHGYIHNDLHNGNILVNKDKNGILDYYISDFGLSKSFNDTKTDLFANEYNRLKGIFTNSWFPKNSLIAENIAKFILSNYEVQI